MKKNLLYIFMALVFIALILGSCSSGKEGEAEKGAIDRMTDKAAKGMADSIQVPLQRARAAAKLQEKKMGELEEAMKDR